MSTSDGKLVTGPFAKWFVIVNGAVPAAVLGWDALHDGLGANPVNFAIRTTGLLGLIFLVGSLAITPLRRLTGWNVLIAPRRQLGLVGFFYIATHFLIFWLYDRGSLADTFAEIIGNVYLWFGFGALVLMIPLAVTSLDSMVTRLGAKRWKLLHRLAYPAVIAGVIHFMLLVKSDIRRPVIFATVLGALLLARVIWYVVDRRKPPRKRRFWSGELVVQQIIQETADVKTFRFAMPDRSPLPFAHIAGQYLNIALMIDGKRVNRSYTIASPPTRNGTCEISVKRIGTASQYLHDHVNEGMKIRIGAPAGKFHFAGAGDRVILVAGGVGITPMMSVVRSLTDRRWAGEIYLLFSVRTSADVIFKDEIAALQAKFPNLHVDIVITSERGHISKDTIRAFVPDLTRGPAMMCGPDAMMTAMRQLLVELGVPDAEVTQEEFKSPLAVVESTSIMTSAAARPDGLAAIRSMTSEITPAMNGAGANVSFRKAGKSIELSELTILEAAEDCGVDIPFECRSGICGQCKTPLVSGKVTMEVQDALTAADKSKGLILACQARAAADVIVDA